MHKHGFLWNNYPRGFYVKKSRIFMGFSIFPVLDKNKWYLYISCVAFCLLIVPNYSWFTNFVSDIYSWNYCKKEWFILIYLESFCMFVSSNGIIILRVSNPQKRVWRCWQCHTHGVFSGEGLKNEKSDINIIIKKILNMPIMK